MSDRRLLFFWVASDQVAGRGHLARCLPLADALQQLGWDPFFLLDSDSPYNSLVSEAGFSWKEMRQWTEPDLVSLVRSTGHSWIVVDRHNVAASFLAVLRSLGLRTVGMSVVGEGVGQYDVLLNINAGHYASSVCQNYIGGKDAIILQKKRLQAELATSVDIFLTLGGSREGALRTPETAASLTESFPGRTLAVSGSSPALESLGYLRPTTDCEFLSYLRGASVVVCSFGSTVYEAAYLGKAMVVLALNEQQYRNASLVLSWEFFQLFHIEDVKSYSSAIRSLLENEECRFQFQSSSLRAVDGDADQRAALQLNTIMRGSEK